MINDLIKYLEGKKVLILGFGMEGYSTYRLIRRHLPEQKVYISDANSKVYEKYEDVQKDVNADIIPTDEYLKELEKYDVIMKTPGLSFKDIDTSKFIDKIKSQIELFLEFIDVFTIGVTGTKGKSTTSSLIYDIISKQREDVHLLGNIGVPLFDEIDKLTKKSIVVLELSSHQLEYVQVSPNVAILLNLFEEHLDHYKSYEHYINAKLNICKFQKADDYFLYSIDNECLREHVEKLRDFKQNVFEISLEGNDKINTNDKLVIRKDNTAVTEEGEVLYTDSETRKILGDHNFNNIMFATTVAKIMNLDMKKANEDVYNFAPLEHRMEFVAEIDGVKYYNDSIATIPASTINGVETLKNVNTLIIGGKDRGIDYSEFAEFLGNTNIEHLICLPDTGWKIADMVVNENMEKYIVNNMEEAVKFAKQVTKKGTSCLLSPAASSYGFFKNFKERGNLFKKFVLER
ncbi:MAG: UDP-N-acetylmuramoyl-L-alanine--D-glutamate ligase [Clostridia bacterium]|nr:UDP-N-acetylmuramoyl-L-alanine--D-glutamate ligase [Clostridia bacterium]